MMETKNTIKIIKKVLCGIVVAIALVYCIASIWLNIIAVHGTDSNAVDAAIDKILAGEKQLVIEYDLIDKLDNRIWCQPELFYTSHGYEYSSIKYLFPFNKYVVTISNKYDDDEISEKQNEIDQVVAQALLELNVENATDYEKVLYSYLWIVQNIEYTQDETNGHNIYGAFVDKKAICDGYANALTYMLSKIGIEAYTIGGAVIENGEEYPHAWTLAYIDGSPYYFDPTHGDKSLHPELQKHYFAVPPQEFYNNHVVDEEFNNIVANITVNVPVKSHFQCDDEIEIMAELSKQYNMNIDCLQHADITAEELISILNEKYGKPSSCEQYLRIKTMLSYVDKDTKESGGYISDVHSIYRMFNGTYHTIASQSVQILDESADDIPIYSTSEAYIDKLNFEAYACSTLYGLSTGWVTYENLYDASQYFVYYSELAITKDTMIRDDGNGHYIVISPAVEMVDGEFATSTQIEYCNRYIVGMIEKDFSSLCFYVSNAQLNENDVSDIYNTDDFMSSVEIFIKLYNFGTVPEFSIQDNAFGQDFGN